MLPLKPNVSVGTQYDTMYQTLWHIDRRHEKWVLNRELHDGTNVMTCRTCVLPLEVLVIHMRWNAVK